MALVNIVENASICLLTLFFLRTEFSFVMNSFFSGKKRIAKN